MRRIAVLLALFVWAAPAQAATVTARDTTESDSHSTYHVRNVKFTAAPGEANRLEFSYDDTIGLRLRDPVGITASAPCVAEDAQTVRCPSIGGFQLQVDLGDGDDTVVSNSGAAVLAGDGNDVVEVPNGLLDGGAGDDTLTAVGDYGSVTGGPGADVLAAGKLRFADRVAGVTVDLVAGTATSAGEVDRLAPGVRFIDTGPGPDVVRAADAAVDVHTGAGDDVIDGSPTGEIIGAGKGNDVVRGHGGDDRLFGNEDDDRLDGGDGQDFLNGDGLNELPLKGGNDVLDGGAGRDELYGDDGRDRVLARDGERDRIGCSYESRGADGFEGDRAIVDPDDLTSWCQHVDGASGLVFHGLTRAGTRWARMVVSCNGSRPCSARARVRGGRAAQRVRVGAGKRVGLPIRLSRAGGGVSARLVTPTSAVLHARLYATRR